MSKIANSAADRVAAKRLNPGAVRKYDVPDAGQDWEDGREEGFKPLTREEAQKLREANPSLSPWAVLAGQLAVGMLVACVAWWLTGKQSAGWSALYGALAVVIPGALLARGLASKVSLINPVTAVTGFFVWEMVKIAATVGMLFAAPRLVADLDWLAMLIGLMVTLNMYWVALLMRPKRKTE